MTEDEKNKDTKHDEALKAYYTDKDYDKAFQIFIKLAEDENFSETAKFYLHRLYINGRGTKKNVQKGIELLEELVELNSALAQNALAHIYYSGFDKFKQDYKKAMYWYKLSIVNILSVSPVHLSHL